MNLYYYNLIHAQRNVDILIKIYLVVLSDMSWSIFIPLHNPFLKFLRLTNIYFSLHAVSWSIVQKRPRLTTFPNT